MIPEMAYFLGMVTGNGSVQRGLTETTVTIDIPHKKMQTEFQSDVSVYVKASITDIRGFLEPLLGASMTFSQNNNKSILSFRKPNSDFLMRELLQYLGNASSTDSVRISNDVFSFSYDERKQFVKGFADVTGYIRRSNYAFKEPNYRVYFEIPNNWKLVVDFCNILKSIDIPVQAIDWAHPNMRDGNLKKYNEGNTNFWKKEHQVKVWALEYQRVGFVVIHKQEALDFFAEKQREYYVNNGKIPALMLHKYYWDTKHKDIKKPIHPGEWDSFIPEEIRGIHYDNWIQIANDLGYKKG